MLAPLKCAVLGVALGIMSAADADGDIKAGQDKAHSCRACHGFDGHGRIKLAGKEQDYLIVQLQDFRSGARRQGMMNLIASKLSDQDIADLTAYFSSQDPKD